MRRQRVKGVKRAKGAKGAKGLERVMRAAVALGVGLWVTCVATLSAQAQDAGEETASDETIVVVDRYDRKLDDPAFVTVVKVDDRSGETTSVAEVLAKSVGVNVRTLGGLGAFSSISVRGASSAHTTVSVDGVPLSRVAFASANLGMFELGSFSEIEVYRGNVPVELGSAALGGAVNFVTAVGSQRHGDTLRLSTGAGSFGARHLRGRWRDQLLGGNFRHSVAVGYRGAKGNYEYFNDNGTPLNVADDAFVDRTNNGFDQVDGVVRARYRRGTLTIDGGTRTLWKRQGVPGVGSVQTMDAALKTLSQVVDMRALRRKAFGVRTLSMSGSVFGVLERQHFTDLLGEVGLANQNRRYRTLSGGATARASYTLPWQTLTFALDTRVDDFDDKDLLAESTTAVPGTQGRRWSGGVAVKDEIRLRGLSTVIIPAIRLDVQRTNPGADWDPIVVAPEELGTRHDLFVNPRVAMRVRVSNSFAIKASAGRYFRAPTLIELFGDRGFLVGNPALEPETGMTGDAGVVFAQPDPYGALDRLYLQGAVFASKSKSTIALIPAGRTAVLENLDGASIIGVEASATGRLWQRVSLTGNYTMIQSRHSSPLISFDGKRLPLRPEHQAYARVDVSERVRGRLLTVWTDVSFTSGNFVDEANTSEIPARLFLGAGIKLTPVKNLLVGFEVKNLTNARVEPIELSPAPRPDLANVNRPISDFLGYPLPGRAFYVTADVTF